MILIGNSILHHVALWIRIGSIPCLGSVLCKHQNSPKPHANSQCAAACSCVSGVNHWAVSMTG